MVVCPICDKSVEKFHPKSHILPKWMDHHDPEKRGLVHFDEEGRQQIIQTGWYASIVCPSCEVAFGPYDQYASLILDEKNKSSLEKSKIKQTPHRKNGLLVGLTLAGVNFLKLHKFALGVVLRSQLERKANGRELLFNEETFLKLRKTYLSDQPLENSFPLCLLGLYEENGLHTTCLLPYNWDKLDDIPVILFQGARHQFYVALAEGNFQFGFSPFLGRADGTFVVPVTDFKNTETFKRVLERVEDSQKYLETKRQRRKD